MTNADSAPCTFGCLDRSADRLFDDAISSETSFALTIADLLANHVGWYLDEHESGVPDFIADLGLDEQPGVYILWRGIDYCEVHNKEIFDAVYVGKAGDSIGTRLRRHLTTKRLGHGLAVEITIWRAINRHAKYVEQLLLDTFAFEANSVENRGTARLRVTVDPAKWN